jgi:hypothetical protein
MPESPPRNREKNPPWFYIALAVQTFVIIIVLGMLKDLLWIL